MNRWTHEHDFDAVLARVSREQGIALPVVQALVATESGFNPAAVKGESRGRSSIGLTQLLLGTAQSLGFNGTAAALADPYTNVTLGVRYLLLQYRRAGQWAGAYSAYNGGWNPAHGMGQPLAGTVAIQVIVDSDADQATPGAQPRYRTVRPGEYGNQPAVDRFIANLRYFTTKAGLVPSQSVPGAPEATGGTRGASQAGPGGGVAGILLTLGLLGAMLTLGRH